MALCAGIDGLGLGLSLVVRDYRTVCHVEREIHAVGVLASRMADKTLHEAPIFGDIATFDGSPWAGKVDVIHAGFACQPWSSGGKRRGKKDSRWLWPEIARIVCEVRPPIVLLENVPGILDGGIQDIFGTMAQEGYDAAWGSFRATDVGAPHRRERVFMLAYSGGVGLKAIRAAHDEHRHNELWDEFDGCGSCYDCHGCVGETWPPGVDDIEAWTSIEEEAPEAAAWENLDDVLRGANGATSWVDSMRACGNGVVPSMAAYAFVDLARSIIEEV